MPAFRLNFAKAAKPNCIQSRSNRQGWPPSVQSSSHQQVSEGGLSRGGLILPASTRISHFFLMAPHKSSSLTIHAQAAWTPGSVVKALHPEREDSCRKQASGKLERAQKRIFTPSGGSLHHRQKGGPIDRFRSFQLQR